MEESELPALFAEMSVAYDECVEMLKADYQIAKKHAPLIIKTLSKMHRVPKGVSELIERRSSQLKDSSEMEGLEPFHEEFWADTCFVSAIIRAINDECFILNRIKR